MTGRSSADTDLTLALPSCQHGAALPKCPAHTNPCHSPALTADPLYHRMTHGHLCSARKWQHNGKSLAGGISYSLCSAPSISESSSDASSTCSIRATTKPHGLSFQRCCTPPNIPSQALPMPPDPINVPCLGCCGTAQPPTASSAQGPARDSPASGHTGWRQKHCSAWGRTLTMRWPQLWPNTEVMSTVRVLRFCDRLSSRKRERTQRDREQEVTGQHSTGQPLPTPYLGFLTGSSSWSSTERSREKGGDRVSRRQHGPTQHKGLRTGHPSLLPPHQHLGHHRVPTHGPQHTQGPHSPTRPAPNTGITRGHHGHSPVPPRPTAADGRRQQQGLTAISAR